MKPIPAARIAAPNLPERIRDELILLVTTGFLQPGDRLNEVHLSEQLGVSRSPLREALRELEGMGITLSRPRLGFYVADLSNDEIIALYEVSPWIHQALIQDVMTYSTSATCAEILGWIDDVDTTDVQSFSRSMLAFRARFLATLHNRYLADQAMGLYRRFFIVAAVVQAQDIEEHISRILTTARAFWAALVRRDAEDARRIIEADCAYWLKDVAPRFTRAPRHGG